MSKKRVVVTGMGVRAPESTGLSEFLEMLQSGKSGIQKIEELETLGFRCQVGGRAKAFSGSHPPDWWEQWEMQQASDFIQLAVAAGREAWISAGLDIPDAETPDLDWETGAIVGSGIAGIDVIGKKVVPTVDSGKIRRLGSYATQNIMPSGAAAHLAAILALGNSVSANSSACCTGTEALLEGYHRIQSGRAKRMLVGASEGYSPYFWATFDTLKAMNARHNNDPEAASRPMSATARGFVPASGAGVLLIEDLDSAQNRGAKILAEVLGGAMNCGGLRNGGSMTFPNPEGIDRCISAAMKAADISYADVDLVSGHLTGTKADPSEIKRWQAAFAGAGAEFPLINAPKSLFGHCLGAAGAVEGVAVVLQLMHGFVHGSRNCEDLHPEIAEIVSQERIPEKMLLRQDLDIVLNASFGFGDVNAIAAFKKWTE